MNAQSKLHLCFLILPEKLLCRQLGDLAWTWTASLQSMMMWYLEGKAKPGSWREAVRNRTDKKCFFMVQVCRLCLQCYEEEFLESHGFGWKWSRKKRQGILMWLRKTKEFSVAKVSSLKFRGRSFSSCSGPASHPFFPTMWADAQWGHSVPHSITVISTWTWEA